MGNACGDCFVLVEDPLVDDSLVEDSLAALAAFAMVPAT